LPLFMALYLLVPIYGQNYSKMTEKAIKKELGKGKNSKEAAAIARKLKKKGFELLGDSNKPLEVVIKIHQIKLNELGENGIEFEGSSLRTKSKNLGELLAKNSVQINYAQQATQIMSHPFYRVEYYDGPPQTSETLSNFFKEYELNVEEGIKTLLSPSYSVIRHNNDETSEIRSFFIIDESKAREIRSQALEAALSKYELSEDEINYFRSVVDTPVK
ncbi:MAG: hypothetical protein K2J78_04980, partial [Muribaculaceae bacterium]|nr:hypothetical protein [Muribaculaceae bacterium]